MAREGVHSRVCSPARRSDGSQPRNWDRRVSPNGESGDARNGTPALARAHMHISARGAIRAHTHADTCFRSRCAGIAPSIEFGIITVSIGVVAAVSAAAAPLLVGPTSPLRLVLVATHVCGFRDHGRVPETPRSVFARSCPCSFARPCGGCLWGAGEPPRSTFARICVRLRVVHGDA